MLLHKLYSKFAIFFLVEHEASLGWGTLYAFAGCGLFFFSVWKLLGVQDFREFRLIVGGFLPRIPKGEGQGRTEFSGLNDLLQYLIDRDKEERLAKKSLTEAEK